MSEIIKSIPEKTWTLVASNVTAGIIYRPIGMGAFDFYFTVRDAGLASPSDTSDKNPHEIDSGKARKLFDFENENKIVSGFPLDVYVWAFNNDTDSADTAKVLVSI